MKNALAIVLGGTLSVSAAADKPRDVLWFEISRQHIALIEPAKAVDKGKFEQDMWGQFEIRIPKASFPIAAPNCKKNILLRAPGIDPDKAGAQEKFEARWQLFQAIHDVADGKRASIEVPVEVKHSPGFAPYMILDAHGKPTLEWCNAFIDTKALNAPQTGKSKQ